MSLQDPMECSMPGSSLCSLLRFISSESMTLSISSPAAPFSSCLQSFPAPGSSPMSRLFTSALHFTKYWSFSINPSNEYSGLISFRIDWFDLLAWFPINSPHKKQSQERPCKLAQGLGFYPSAYKKELDIWLCPLYQMPYLCYLI